MRERLYTGSVKDVYADGDTLVFAFSDRYSIYDWGQMPDAIPHKGRALASMAAAFFEYLQARGLESHFLEQSAPDEIRVRPVQVLRPPWRDGAYDYGAYAQQPVQALVPLEVIFRLQLAQGNSLERRLQADPDYLAELGLDALPDRSTLFEPPLVEFSTKLESTDRYLRRREILVQELLTAAELERLRTHTQTIAGQLNALFKTLGVQLWDGKVEYGYGATGARGRSFFLVDSIGPDELRLSYGGLHLSKEFLRQIYTGSRWLAGVQEAKALARERGRRDWKAICTDELGLLPRHLSAQELEVASLLYQALANAVSDATGREPPFDASKTLEAWHRQARSLLNQGAE